MKNTIISEQKNRTIHITAIGLMTALICIIAPFSIPLPASPVPLTLTNLIIFIAVYTLGMKDATICVTVYLILGAAGLPVFSSFTGGPGKLAGPTGGYLAGFLFLALLQGFLTEKAHGNNIASISGMILGMAGCYTFGTAWLSWQMELNFFAALSIGVLPYLPGDAIKIVIAAVSGPKLRAAIRKQRT